MRYACANRNKVFILVEFVMDIAGDEMLVDANVVTLHRGGENRPGGIKDVASLGVDDLGSCTELRSTAGKLLRA